jgi:hypothetical protein
MARATSCKSGGLNSLQSVLRRRLLTQVRDGFRMINRDIYGVRSLVKDIDASFQLPFCLT